MTTSRKPVPVAAFMADRGILIVVLDDGTVYWAVQDELQSSRPDIDVWQEAQSLPGTVAPYLREEKMLKGEG